MNWPHFVHGISFEWRRLRRLGLPALAAKIAMRTVSALIWLALLPVSIGLHLAGYRRIMVFTDRIGHLALEPDCLLKDQALGNVPARRWFILAVPGRVANAHLLGYWEQHAAVIRGRALCFVLESMTRWGLLRQDVSGYILAVRSSQAAYRVYSEWGDRAPLLRLTQDDAAWGRHQLRGIGIPEDAWFVCVHVREAGFSPIDEELHSHRNGDIDAAIPAMMEIVRRGGWVIRIGDATMKPLPAMPRVVDYAHHSAKSDRLDVVLCAMATFILGNTSGIALVGTVFGVPCAVANMIPTPTLWFGRRDISIPKLLWSDPLRRYLRFCETFTDPISRYRYASMYRNAGIRLVDSTTEDIRELVSEMLERLAGSFEVTDEDTIRIAKLTSLLNLHEPEWRPSGGMGVFFLRRHAWLLESPDGEAPTPTGIAHSEDAPAST